VGGAAPVRTLRAKSCAQRSRILFFAIYAACPARVGGRAQGNWMSVCFAEETTFCRFRRLEVFLKVVLVLGGKVKGLAPESGTPHALAPAIAISSQGGRSSQCLPAPGRCLSALACWATHVRPSPPMHPTTCPSVHMTPWRVAGLTCWHNPYGTVTPLDLVSGPSEGGGGFGSGSNQWLYQSFRHVSLAAKGAVTNWGDEAA
jgi:hypothetical protein